MSTGRLRPTVVTQRNGAAAAEHRVDLVGARVHIDIVIPRTSIAAKMRLLSRAEHHAIRAQVRGALQGAGFPVDGSAIAALGAHAEWAAEIAVRTLQKAVRNPHDVDLELALLEEWRECDDDQLGALQKTYDDLAAKLDPLGADVEITEAEFAELVAAAKKKDSDSLMSFGSQKLARFAITLVSQLSTSSTPTSSSGPSPEQPPASSSPS